MSINAYDQTIRLVGGIQAAVAVTPNDSTDFEACRALWIGTAGDVTVDLIGDGTTKVENVTFANVPVGFFPVKATRVYETGTDAQDILRCN